VAWAGFVWKGGHEGSKRDASDPALPGKLKERGAMLEGYNDAMKSNNSYQRP
jgi:hypothetical protein